MEYKDATRSTKANSFFEELLPQYIEGIEELEQSITSQHSSTHGNPNDDFFQRVACRRCSELW